MTPKQALEKAVEAAGGTRAGLARLLGITMQAVGQWDEAPTGRVLEIERLTGVSRHDLRPDLYPRPESSELAEPKRAWRAEAPETFAQVRLRPDGSAVIPASLMKAAGFPAEAVFTAHMAEEGEIRLLAGDAAIRYAQDLVRRAIPEKVDLVDELSKERRREAEKFGKDGRG